MTLRAKSSSSCSACADLLASQEDQIRERLERCAQSVETYAEMNGGVHDEDCPCDDTCACSFKVVNDGVNDAVHALRELGSQLTAISTERDALRAALQAEKVVSQEHWDYYQKAEADLSTVREALKVECTCRVIEKCLRCEAIDAALEGK